MSAAEAAARPLDSPPATPCRGVGPAASRRAFVTRVCGAVVGLGLGACGGIAAVPVTPRDGTIRLDLTSHPGLARPGGWLHLAPLGSPTPIYVVALDDGDFASLSPICTHQGCTVDISGAQLICPCHGSTYDRTGTVVRGPAERPLARFDTRRDGDTLVIRMP